MLNNIVVTLGSTEDACQRLKSDPSPLSIGVTILNLWISNIIWHIPATLAYSFISDIVLLFCLLYRLIKIKMISIEVIAPLVI